MLRSLLALGLLFAFTLALGCKNQSSPMNTPPVEDEAPPPVEIEEPESPDTETPEAKPGDVDTGEQPDNAKPEDDGKEAEPDGDEGEDGKEADDDDNADDAKDKPEGDEGEDAKEDDGGNDDAKDEPSKGDEPEAAAVSPFKSERVVMFTNKGPLLVELHLSIDNNPHDQALGNLVNYVLKEADTNGDGKATWDELTENPKFTYGQLGNVELNTAAMRRNAIQLYDVIRNGRVDPSEVPRFLTRNAGGSRSFDFRSANYYRDINRGDSPVFRLLDSNEDGRIDYDEADRAAIRLQSRDADGDGILLADELASATDDRPGPLTQRRISAASSSAWLGGKPKWGNVLYAMEEQYMLGGSLEKSAFDLDPTLFDRLNKDGDERIDADEIQALNEVEPHVRIEAHFGERDEAKQSLEVTHFDPRLEEDGAEIKVRKNRITIRLPHDHVLIFLKDEARARQVDQQAQALLAQYDADNNEYLDEDEFPDAAPGLMGGIEAYDTDEDGKVYKKELVAYLANVRVAQRSQIHSRAGDLTDALFDALDTSRDGRIDGREGEAIAQVLRELDTDKDGELIVDEIPGSMALAVVRGDPQQADTLFSIPVAQPEPPENAPRWFIRMDRNRDGVIAPGEFLGDDAQFKSLDANTDGFVAADEAPQDSKKVGTEDGEARAEEKEEGDGEGEAPAEEKEDGVGEGEAPVKEKEDGVGEGEAPAEPAEEAAQEEKPKSGSGF